MNHTNPPLQGGAIDDTMIGLTRSSKLQRIIVAGPNAAQLMFELHRHGYGRVATTATGGLPQGQYAVALVDWSLQSIAALEATLDWLVYFLAPAGVLVIRLESFRHSENRKLETVLKRLGFQVEVGTRCEHGFAISARRLEKTRTDASPRPITRASAR